MEKRKKLMLLQVTDSVFPIGAYSHSYGLETYIQKNLICGAQDAWNYLLQSLRFPLVYTELLGMRLVFEAVAAKDWEKAARLELLVQAAKIPMETRTASQKMAARFIKTVEPLLEGVEAEWFLGYVRGGVRTGGKQDGAALSHMVNGAYGAFGAAVGIDLEELMTCYLYSQVSAITVNCVKTIPLSQTDGQRLLYRSLPFQEEAVQKALNAPESWLGLSLPGFDIRCMEHEGLYSRLYMS